MKILAIDPGPERSAWVVYDGERPLRFEIMSNNAVMGLIEELKISGDCHVLVIEQIAAMGMSVGAEVFETVWWTGRFCQAFGNFDRVKRMAVKMHLCGNSRAKDTNIRQALIDRFGPGKDIAIGNKKSPGPLYGVSKDCWSALALAVTWCDRHAMEPA